jgi:benzoyl-CoA reductase subunit C
MNFSETFETLRAEIEDLSYPTVRTWLANHPGGKIAGYFPVYVPAELAHAGGFLPVCVAGAGNRLEIDHADSRIQSFVCSVSRSTLELGLTGHLDFLDVMLFPSICDVARNLSGVWARNFPRTRVHYLHLPQNPGAASSIAYYRGELAHLRGILEEISGRRITDADIASSLALFNEQRALLGRIAAIRRDRPELLSAAEFALLLRAASLRPREEHTALLCEVARALPGRNAKARDRVRVVLEGSFCEEPPLELLEVIEEAGCAVVTDDLLLGHRWFDAPVEPGPDPLLSLAEAYVLRSVPSSVCHHGPVPRGTRLLEKVSRAGADGVLFCAAKFCEPALLDYVLMKQDLEREGVPFLAFEFEEKMGVFESIRTQVETFGESILFFGAKGGGR